MLHCRVFCPYSRTCFALMGSVTLDKRLKEIVSRFDACADCDVFPPNSTVHTPIRYEYIRLVRLVQNKRFGPNNKFDVQFLTRHFLPKSV